jgi:hypothetical protein
MGIYALGRLEFAEKFTDQTDDPAIQAALIETYTFLTYQRQLNNLSIQESRLRRQREKDMAELRRLQQERTQQKNGFEFSTQNEKAHVANAGCSVPSHVLPVASHFGARGISVLNPMETIPPDIGA